ncbi:unnamed protein product, partial [Hapterophycus canaliculatus]
MRLLTHNVLRSPMKGVVEGYPLRIEVVDVQVVESEVKEEFVKQMANTLDWGALCKAASEVKKRE